VEKTTPGSRIKVGTGCFKIRRGVWAVLMEEVFSRSCVITYYWRKIIELKNDHYHLVKLILIITNQGD
jgi:hypothetical protein